MEVSESAPERTGKKLHWHGLVLRVEPSRWFRRLLDWKEPGRHSQQSTKSRWINGLQDDMAARGLSEVD